jgi:hypothetical protein
MEVCIAIALVWARFSGCLHGWAISYAIASILLHKNEPNKIYSESTKKDEKIGPIPNLIAQSV